MPSRARAVVSALVLATSLQCQGRKPGQSDDASSQGPGKPFVAESEPSELAPVERAQELLPPDTPLMFEGRSIARAAEVFHRDKVEKEAPEFYAAAARDLQEVFGVDIMVPANLPSIGVDPDGAVGVAVLDIPGAAFAVWARLSDPGKFRETAIAAAGRAGKKLTPLSLGGAEILKDPDGPAAIVLREPFAVFVMSRPPREGRRDVDWARAIGTMDPSQSLANSANYRKATAGWVDTDALVYADFAGLMGSLAEKQSVAAGSDWAEQELAAARRGGAAPEEIARLEAQAKQVADEAKRWEARDRAKRELVRFMFGGLSAVAMRIDAKRSGLVVEGRVQQTPDAVPASLVRNQEAAAPLTWALDGMPVMLAAGALEVDAAIDFVDRVARSEGESWKTLVEEVHKKTGVDVDAELRPRLTGVAGFAITLEGELKKATPKTLRKLVGFAAHAEVDDPAQVEAVLGRALPKLDLDGHNFKKEREGGWSVDVPKFRKVHVKVAGKHVVVSTDPGLAARLAAGKAGTIAKRMRPSAAYGALSLKGQAFTYAQDFGALAAFLLASRSVDMRLPPGDAPRSRTARRKRAELEKLDAQIIAQQERVDAAELERILAAVDPVGATVLVAREEDDGLVVQGGQFIRAPDLGDVVVRAATGIVGMNHNPERQKLHDLFERRFELEQELRRLQEPDTAKPPKRR
jgi:hypothetical protein